MEPITELSLKIAFDGLDCSLYLERFCSGYLPLFVGDYVQIGGLLADDFMPNNPPVVNYRYFYLEEGKLFISLKIEDQSHFSTRLDVIEAIKNIEAENMLSGWKVIVYGTNGRTLYNTHA